MAKTHKKQHFVPASYMKAWCDPDCPPGQDPYVWVYPRAGGTPFRRSPRKLFTETDMYTIERADGTRDLRIEATLSTLEDRFVGIRKNVFEARRPLEHDEHLYLCFFVGAAHFRTPTSRDHQAQQWGNVLRIADDLAQKMACASHEKRAAAAQMATPGNGHSLTHEQVRALATKPIQNMIAPMLAAVVPPLAKMNLAVLCTDDSIGFLTSDHPCAWFDPELYKLPPLLRSPALGSSTIEVTMPISPRQCLYLSWNNMVGYLDIPAYALQEMNRRHRGYCNEHVVIRKEYFSDYWLRERPLPLAEWERRYHKG
ncbi:DUF4238 domain-containing protein [Burkholderia sp. BCC1977]|uniref:DUF4238 domain-containing protein n=1 Tax=Burkholderia sp. BCC1977 TaxID=2817440 RepID=UPI002ABDDF07|nr:DUF4238 domain-containing protein [Burkholderia sp. BCC1977]